MQYLRQTGHFLLPCAKHKSKMAKTIRHWGLKLEEFTAWLLGRKLDYEIQAEQAKHTEIGYGEWKIILLLHNRMLYRPANEWERYFPVLDNCCEKGHQLERFRAYEGTVDRWNCNICHAVIPMQNLTRGCRICDWDICIQCTTHIQHFFYQFWKERTAPRFLQCTKKSKTAAMTLRKAIKHANSIQERDLADVIVVRSPMFYLCAVTQLKRIGEGKPIARLPIELVRMVSETLGTRGKWGSLGL